MDDHTKASTSDIPEDERVTVPDLSRVLDADDDDVDPFDPDLVPSDSELPAYEDPDDGEA